MSYKNPEDAAAYLERTKTTRKIANAKWYEANRERRRLLCAIYYQENKEQIRARNTLYRQEHQEEYSRHRHLRRLRVYGVTNEQLGALREAQSGKCAICENALLPGRGTNIDHDHETGEVRGLLCSQCNRGLGHFLDDWTLLYTAG